MNKTKRIPMLNLLALAIDAVISNTEKSLRHAELEGMWKIEAEKGLGNKFIAQLANGRKYKTTRYDFSWIDRKLNKLGYPISAIYSTEFATSRNAWKGHLPRTKKG